MKKVVLIVFMCTATLCFSQVGIGTTNPVSTLDINGNLSLKHITLAGSATATLLDDGVYISVNPQATDQEFRLPDPTLFPGRVYIIRNINNTITARLTTTAGLLFPKGSTTGVTQVFMYENNRRTLIVISDGSNWTFFE